MRLFRGPPGSGGYASRAGSRLAAITAQRCVLLHHEPGNYKGATRE
ncbi:hypothetical protein QMK19_21165 [Streptomyces sp. H10-C2]|nr:MULTISPECIES: hypothetical protein [unclassified Streptomyces]MDJ0345358.1 hypothetical protein [Streptomyces sp. PH10-H1]MDJ0372113.1 hypothetical protein [Streptomyces sp. H10-C2]